MLKSGNRPLSAVCTYVDRGAVQWAGDSALQHGPVLKHPLGCNIERPYYENITGSNHYSGPNTQFENEGK